MSESFVRRERAALTTLFDAVGPDAPTLCEGWSTAHLAAHLLVREADPLAGPGIIVPPLARLTEMRMMAALNRYGYSGVVDRVRRGPARLSVFALPGMDELANTVEYFVHHEDVRRAIDPDAHPRDLGEHAQDDLWRRLTAMARFLGRRIDFGLVLERTQSADSNARPQSVHAAAGAPIVTLVGEPAELLLYSYGRRDVARIRIIGVPDALVRFGAARFGV